MPSWKSLTTSAEFAFQKCGAAPNTFLQFQHHCYQRLEQVWIRLQTGSSPFVELNPATGCELLLCALLGVWEALVRRAKTKAKQLVCSPSLFCFAAHAARSSVLVCWLLRSTIQAPTPYDSSTNDQHNKVHAPMIRVPKAVRFRHRSRPIQAPKHVSILASITRTSGTRV